MIKKYFDLSYPIWHPYTNQVLSKSPIKIKKAKGSYLYDDKGNQYIDTVSSWWVNIHGHSHSQIAKAIFKQAKLVEQVLFANFTHQPAIDLATKVLGLLNNCTPNKNHFCKVFYSDNGSTAIEVAIKMAIQYWVNKKEKRNKILALTHSYHGDTFGAMSVSGRSLFSEHFDSLLFKVDFIDLNNNWNEEIKKRHLNEYAFFIYEPLVQGASGMKMYEVKLLNALLAFLKSQNIILIADEVMTGWGRTGKIFASDYLKTAADIICLSKGLTGGFLPLGLSVCNKKIYSTFLYPAKEFTFYHGHSFTANPISCAAAIASINILIKIKTLAQIEMISLSNKNFVKKISKNKMALNPRSMGTIFAFEINAPISLYNQNISQQITAYFITKKIFIRPLGNTIYIMPPYCISKVNLNYVYNEIECFLNELKLNKVLK